MKATIHGVELDAEFVPHPSLTLHVGATLLDAEVTDNPTDPLLGGNDLEYTPDERATLGVTWRAPHRLVAAARLRHVGTRWAEPENENLLDAHSLLDVNLSRRVGARVELFAGVENLLDEDYRIDFTSNIFRVGPPRVIHAGLRLRAGG
jgi:outer membrane receptor protein involved in Fe transport